MKKILFKPVALLAFVFASTACNDIVTYPDEIKAEEENKAAPKVEAIYATPNLDFEITQADMGQNIQINGSDLSDVQSILFSDVSVDIRSIYSNNKLIVVQIPRKLPVNDTQTLTIRTNKGEVSVPFKVNIPQLIVSKVSNEFANPGDTVRISGDNFDLYELTEELAEIKIGDTPVNVIETGRDYIDIELPNSLSKTTSVFKISGGKAPKTYEWPYRNMENVLVDYNDVNTYVTFSHWNQNDGEGQPVYPYAGEHFVVDGSNTERDPEPINGPYARFIRTWEATWKNSVMAQFDIDLTQDMIDNYSIYAVKFELWTHPSYSINGGGAVWLAWFGKDYQWRPQDEGLPLNTYGKWETIAVPLSKMLNMDSGTGLPNATPGVVRKEFAPGIQSPAPFTWNIAVCNIRLGKTSWN